MMSATTDYIWDESIVTPGNGFIVPCQGRGPERLLAVFRNGHERERYTLVGRLPAPEECFMVRRPVTQRLNILLTDGTLLFRDSYDRLEYSETLRHFIAGTERIGASGRRITYNIMDRNGNGLLDREAQDITVHSPDTVCVCADGIYNFFDMNTRQWILDVWLKEIIRHDGKMYAYNTHG